MRKVVRFIVLLPFRILSLPVMAALFAAEWIGIFLVSMSAMIIIGEKKKEPPATYVHSFFCNGFR